MHPEARVLEFGKYMREWMKMTARCWTDKADMLSVVTRCLPASVLSTTKAVRTAHDRP